MKRIFLSLALILASLVSAQAQYIEPYSGAVSRTNNSKMADIVSVFDFIPVGLQAAIKAGTSTTDVSSYLTAMHVAVPAGVKFLFPAGQYNIGAGATALTGRAVDITGVTFTGGGSITGTGTIISVTNPGANTTDYGFSTSKKSVAISTLVNSTGTGVGSGLMSQLRITSAATDVPGIPAISAQTRIEAPNETYAMTAIMDWQNTSAYGAGVASIMRNQTVDPGAPTFANPFGKSGFIAFSESDTVPASNAFMATNSITGVNQWRQAFYAISPLAATLRADMQAAAGVIDMRRVNTNFSAPSGLVSGDTIYQIDAYGYGASAWSSAPRASVQARASQNWTDANQGTSVFVRATRPSTTTTNDLVRFDGDIPLSVLQVFGDNAGQSLRLVPQYDNTKFWDFWTGNSGGLSIKNSAAIGLGINSTGDLFLDGTSITLQNAGVTGKILWAPSTANKTITLPNGTTNFTATSGIVQQASAGAAFTVGSVALANLATQGANTIIGNATSGAAAPTALAVGSCSATTEAVNWTTNAGPGCNTSITAASVPVGGIIGSGANVVTFLTTPSSANLLAALTDEVGTGKVVFNIAPALTGEVIVTASAAGVSNTFTIAAGGNTVSDVPTFRITSLAGTVVFNQFGDAANGNFRIKSLGATSFHAGDVAVSAANEWLKINTNGVTEFKGTTASTSTTTGNLINSGGFGNAGAIWAGTYVATTPVAVGGLTACAAGTKGARQFVTDSNAASYTAGIGTVVAAGGTTNVPVVCDGTSWRIGANDNQQLNKRKVA